MFKCFYSILKFVARFSAGYDSYGCGFHVKSSQFALLWVRQKYAMARANYVAMKTHFRPPSHFSFVHDGR